MALTLNKVEAGFYKAQFTTEIRLKLYYKIASFLRQGVPLNDILLQLNIQYAKAKKGDIRAIILKEWLAGLSAGRAFSIILSDWVPPAESMLIQAGEKSGDLSIAFANAIDITESSQKMKGALTSQMSYPIVLLLVLFSLIYMFSTEAIPVLADVKDPDTWPNMSRKLYALAQFVSGYWHVVLMSMGGFVLFAAYTIPRVTGPVREIMDKLPPWSVYKTFQSSVFLVSLAAMMKTGTPIVDAIKALKTLSNEYVSSHLKRMILRIDGGRKLGESMNTGFFNKETGIDIEVYGQVAEIQDAMDQLGRTSIEDGVNRITKIAEALKNIIMVCVGLYVIWVYYSFFILTKAIGADAGT